MLSETGELTAQFQAPLKKYLGDKTAKVLEVHVIDRPDEPSVGAGEAAQGPVAAALANAVYDALGVRVRELPLTADTLLRAVHAAESV